MAGKHHIKSHEFEGSFVRVRGRLSREGQVRWSPCLRTFRQATPIKVHTDLSPRVTSGLPTSIALDSPSQERPPSATLTSGLGRLGPIANERYYIDFQDRNGKVLESAPTEPEFFAMNQQWATFVQRLPYQRKTERVVLRRGKRELGVLIVTPQLPKFELVHPVRANEIDTEGIMHLRWKVDPTTSKKYPLACFIRFSSDQKRWYRPGVNLTSHAFDLDLREMPGGDDCVAQVVATNGYQTAFVETPHFKLKRKPAEILLGETSGPVLFAQGFSREDGPIVGTNITWLADGQRPVGTGGAFDARDLHSGVHELAVVIREPSGHVVSQILGLYDGETGLLVRSQVGLTEFANILMFTNPNLPDKEDSL